ncbi:MAG: hypothetical protein JSR60_05555 [Proteobacteria bacterium]|nr:hypothetical protein [Pseudomonadota bacterium]
MNIRALMVSAALCAMAAASFAATPPMLVRGTITAIDGKTVTVRKDDGTTITGAIAPTTSFSAVEPRRFDQIKSTDFVGITSVPGPGGALKAEEIHIIPLKGLGEGSYPWDHLPGGAKGAGGNMTNGTVATVQSGPASTMGSMTNGTVTMAGAGEWKLQVTYHGSAMVNGKCVGLAGAPGGTPCTGVATVLVTPSTPVVAIVPAKDTDAKPGLAVFGRFTQAPDGKFDAGALVLEKNGVKPQM